MTIELDVTNGAGQHRTDSGIRLLMSRVRFTRSRQAGVTLIELMIAVVLTAILLTVAVPAMGNFVANSRQTGAINDLVASMHIARSTAVTTNSRVTLCASRSGADCDGGSLQEGWIVFADRDNDVVLDANEAIVSSSDSVDRLTIQSADFGRFLMYRPNGRVANAGLNGTAGEFTICDDRGADHARVLIVDISGRPRLSDHLLNGNAPACI